MICLQDAHNIIVIFETRFFHYSAHDPVVSFFRFSGFDLFFEMFFSFSTAGRNIFHPCLEASSLDACIFFSSFTFAFIALKFKYASDRVTILGFVPQNLV